MGSKLVGGGSDDDDMMTDKDLVVVETGVSVQFEFKRLLLLITCVKKLIKKLSPKYCQYNNHFVLYNIIHCVYILCGFLIIFGQLSYKRFQGSMKGFFFCDLYDTQIISLNETAKE